MDINTYKKEKLSSYLKRLNSFAAEIYISNIDEMKDVLEDEYYDYVKKAEKDIDISLEYAKYGFMRGFDSAVEYINDWKEWEGNYDPSLEGEMIIVQTKLINTGEVGEVSIGRFVNGHLLLIPRTNEDYLTPHKWKLIDIK